MTRTLRSNFPRGSSLWAVRRAQWRALGITDADMEKPKIAIVNTSSELAICFSHLDRIVPVVKEAIRAAGGLPFEVRTAAPSDFIHSAGRRGTYILPSRDLIVNDIEVQVEGAQLDGMVCLTSCDKTIPGQLMAAARLDIPSILVICGYQASGEYRGHHMDIEEVFLGAGHHATGKITLDELKEMSEDAIRSPGVCSGMGTANSMHSVCEGARHVAAGRRSDPGHEPSHARACASLRPPHRRDGMGGPATAENHDAGSLRQCRRGRAGPDGLDQLHQASSGHSRRGRRSISTSTSCSRT